MGYTRDTPEFPDSRPFALAIEGVTEDGTAVGSGQTVSANQYVERHTPTSNQNLPGHTSRRSLHVEPARLGPRNTSFHVLNCLAPSELGWPPTCALRD